MSLWRMVYGSLEPFTWLSPPVKRAITLAIVNKLR